MPSSLALGLCSLFILWLFVRDKERQKKVSIALWIPLTWAFIIASRPASLWLGVGGAPESSDAGLQDKLIDKALFLFLIAAGLFVVSKRRASWRSIIDRNRWIFAYFLYLGISVLWSDEPFVSFKRWIKDFGNVVMVLIILSEDHPGEAVKAFLARWAFLVIPISVLILKYYSHLGRNYDSWTNQPVAVGIATDKNTFGMALFVCGLSLIWIMLELGREKIRRIDKRALLICSALLVLTAWLLRMAHSATAASCTVLGVCILLAVRVPAIRSQVKQLGTYTVGFALLVVLLQVSGLWDLVVKESAEAVGRDVTLHGRADIWRGALKEDINPLIGVGFYSFWSPERNQRVSGEGGFYYQLGTAHNGYIETYLNSGLIGVLLLIVMITNGAKRIKSDVLGGSSFGVLRIAFLITILIYNITESAFDRLVPVWFTLLLMIVDYPGSQKDGMAEEVREPSGDRLQSNRGRFVGLARPAYG